LPVVPHERFAVPRTEVRRVADPSLEGFSVFGKIEGTLPSLSTKYRQCAMATSAMIGVGIDEIVMTSSGNSGSSFMYWADVCEGALKVHTFAAHLHAHRLLFNGRHSSIHIAKTDLVETEAVAKQFAVDNGIHYEGGFFNPFRREGLKTSYMEGMEQLDWNVDVVIQGISSGMGILAADSAFRQLQAGGLIAKPPRVVCVQQDTCQPMIEADSRGLDAFPLSLIVREPDGIAQAILRGNPVNSYPYVRGIVKTTGGRFCSVTQQQIADAYAMLRQLAIPGCHAAATTLAAARRLASEGWLKPTDRCLLMLTGGLLPGVDIDADPVG